MKATIAVLDKRGNNTTLSSHDKQHCLRLGDATVLFDGRIYSPTSGASGTEIIAKKLQQTDHLEASEAFLKEVEGDFAFIIAEPERIIAGRDPVGVQPLYYGENRGFAALASNRKALWKLGVDEAQSFPPGHLAFVSREGFKFKPVKTLVYSEPKQVAMQEAAETLQKMLEQAVRRRVSGTKEIAVAFSGGLDSSVVAFLAKKCHPDVRLFHVSLENQPETEEAKKAADELNLPIQITLFTESDVEKVVAKVVDLIEEPNPIKTSIVQERCHRLPGNKKAKTMLNSLTARYLEACGVSLALHSQLTALHMSYLCQDPVVSEPDAVISSLKLIDLESTLSHS